MATSPKSSDHFEKELLSNSAHFTVIVDAQSKDVMQCFLRQTLQHEQIFQPHLIKIDKQSADSIVRSALPEFPIGE